MATTKNTKTTPTRKSTTTRTKKAVTASRSKTKKASEITSPTSQTSSKFNYCSEREVAPREFANNVSSHRASMILMSHKKWANGTKLKYYFFNGGNDGSPSSWKGTNAQKSVVRKAFQEWKKIGIGLDFEETTDRFEAEIRVGFMRGDGSWSYLGRDIIDISSSPDERTMNFGWNISNDLDTAIHEIGHTLGAPHEHQNPNAGIEWDEEAVYETLSKSPNYWDRGTTYRNIIRKLSPNSVVGSNHDADSVMHYPFGPGLIKSPASFKNGIYPAGGLSNKDKEFAKIFYPPLRKSDYQLLEVGLSQPMDIQEREQKNFTFIPDQSKKYTIESFGEMDTVMVLFEKTKSGFTYLSGDDDSGNDYNSKITYRLLKGREYAIRVRLYFKHKKGSGSVMVH